MQLSGQIAVSALAAVQAEIERLSEHYGPRFALPRRARPGRDVDFRRSPRRCKRRRSGAGAAYCVELVAGLAPSCDPRRRAAEQTAALTFTSGEKGSVGDIGNPSWSSDGRRGSSQRPISTIPAPRRPGQLLSGAMRDTTSSSRAAFRRFHQMDDSLS